VFHPSRVLTYISLRTAPIASTEVVDTGERLLTGSLNRFIVTQLYPLGVFFDSSSVA
jgi:hypothetical protein